MRKIVKQLSTILAVLCILIAALSPLSASAQSGVCDGSGPGDVVDITVVGSRGTSIFRITCVSHVGNFWTYRVEELPGSRHDLSHWVLGIVTCLDNIVGYVPEEGVEIGQDGNIDFHGIKWNVEDGFTSAEFTVELDDDYPASLMPIQVLAKASTGYATGDIVGPDCSVTAIELSSFSASRDGNSITVNWETAVEIDNAGFNLYRGAMPNGPLVKINDQLIAAEGSGSSYSYSDVVDDGEYYYVLEDIDTSGVATRHIPVSAVGSTPDAPIQTYLFLPFIGELN